MGGRGGSSKGGGGSDGTFAQTLKEGRGHMRVKEWVIDKIEDESRKYNRYIDVTEYSRQNAVGMVKADKDGFVEIIADQILKETEKAIQVQLSTGGVVGSAKGWRAWIPKSQISDKRTPSNELKRLNDAKWDRLKG